LIHTLLYGTAAETVTSFSENELSGDLFNARTSGANYKRRNGGNEKSIFVTFVDFPGVAQWRRPTLQRSSTSGAIVVVVDVSEGVKSDVVSSTADLLFDLFTSQSALSSNQPILIVANKALSTEGSNNGSNKNISLEKLLQKCLEEELVRLRSSRGAVAVAGEDDEDKGGVLGSTAGGGFSFDDKDCCKSQVSWLTIYDTTTSTSSSNKKKKLQLDDLKDWISNVVTA
jgi:signal recognition particle receptor subunit beta